MQTKYAYVTIYGSMLMWIQQRAQLTLNGVISSVAYTIPDFAFFVLLDTPQKVIQKQLGLRFARHCEPVTNNVKWYSENWTQDFSYYLKPIALST